MTQPIGLFGLGLIGKSLTRRLLTAGHCVIGHDPDAAQIDAFAEMGGSAVSSSQIWDADVVLAAVFDTDQLASLIDGAPQNTNSILISTSTCDPSRMPELASLATKKNITLVEAPLSGTSKDLGNGTAVFLLGGEQAAIENLGWLWPILGRSHHWVGAIGNANRAKLAVNLVLGLNRAALAEGLVFAQGVGLSPADFLELLQDTAASSAVMPSKGPKMVARNFSPLGRIRQSAKDFALIRSSAKAVGQDLPFAGTYLRMMADAIEAGHGDLDNAAILLPIEASKADLEG